MLYVAAKEHLTPAMVARMNLFAKIMNGYDTCHCEAVCKSLPCVIEMENKIVNKIWGNNSGTMLRYFHCNTGFYIPSLCL